MAFEENWSNDYVSTIAGGGFLAGALSAVVTSAAGAPAPPFRWKVVTAGGVVEYIMVKTVVGTTFSWSGAGDRGLEGTSAIDHAAGETAGAPLTAGGLANGLVRQLISGASGNLSLSPAGGQGAVTADIIAAPTFTGLVTGALGFRDSRGQSGFNMPMLFSKKNGDGATNKVSFTAIPSTFSRARLSWNARTTSGTNGEDGLGLQFNTDTGANYANERLNAVGAGNPGTALTAQDGGVLVTSLTMGFATGGGSTANHYGRGSAELLDYSNATTFKGATGMSGVSKGTGLATQNIELLVGTWISTAPITQIDVLAGAGFWTTASVFWLDIWA